MKNSVLSLVVFAASLFSSTSFALVIEDANCIGVDQNNRKIEVTIMDNQGIGFPRTSRPFATVTDVATGKIILSKAVEAQPASASFVGSAAEGGAAAFDLFKPSVQPRVAIPVRHAIVAGHPIVVFQLSAPGLRADMNCSVFNDF